MNVFCKPRKSKWIFSIEINDEMSTKANFFHPPEDEIKYVFRKRENKNNSKSLNSPLQNIYTIHNYPILS